MIVKEKREKIPAKHAQVYYSQTINNKMLARNASLPMSNQGSTQNIEAYRASLAKDADANLLDSKKSQEISEIRKIVNFISFFMTYDFVSGKAAVKELRNLIKKLTKLPEFAAPILSGRRTVQEVAEKYGWGLVTEKLLRDIKEKRIDDNSIETISNMLLKAKSDVKKSKTVKRI